MYSASRQSLIIERKTLELGRYLVGRTGRLDFSEHPPAYGKGQHGASYTDSRSLPIKSNEARNRKEYTSLLAKECVRSKHVQNT